MSEKIVEEFDIADVNRETALVEYKKDLFESELAEKAAEMAELDSEIDRIEAEKAVLMAQYSAKIKDKKAQIKKHLKAIKEGFEVIEEECTFDFIWGQGIVEYYSCETGEVVKTREITNDERQMKLFKDKEDAAKKKTSGNQSGSDGGEIEIDIEQ